MMDGEIFGMLRRIIVLSAFAAGFASFGAQASPLAAGDDGCVEAIYPGDKARDPGAEPGVSSETETDARAPSVTLSTSCGTPATPSRASPLSSAFTIRSQVSSSGNRVTAPSSPIRAGRRK